MLTHYCVFFVLLCDEINVFSLVLYLEVKPHPAIMFITIASAPLRTSGQ
jgi:hypothetical protein